MGSFRHPFPLRHVALKVSSPCVVLIQDKINDFLPGSRSSASSDEQWWSRIRDPIPRSPIRTASGRQLFYVRTNNYMSASTGLNSSFVSATNVPRPSRSWHGRPRGSDSMGKLYCLVLRVLKLMLESARPSTSSMG